ncbi:HNH endonuclease [Streptomyces platensis]|uniref:HNH endonuclease n=1 Tax=Streptomyces platensis TaxID=58346 RepID=UPI002ED194FD|nr:HNH endonuclease [Streptomyces platensis]
MRREDPRVKAQAASNGRRYRALKFGAEYDGHQPEDLFLHWDEEDLYCCVVCGGPFEHIDHNVPLIRGGSHTLDNLVPLCADHNLAKSGKCPYRFIAELFPGLTAFLAPYFDVHERLTDEEIERRTAAYFDTA